MILDLLGERSQLNSWKKHIFGLFAYASGATRQMIAVLNTLGICSSYPTLAGTQKRTGKLAFKLDSQQWCLPGGENVLDRVSTTAGIPPLPSLGELQSNDDTDNDNDEPLNGIPSAAMQTDDPQTIPASTPACRRRPVDPLVSTVGLQNFRNLGLLRTISLSRRVAAKRLVHEQLVEHVYDNINFMRRTEEQTLGHKDNMENGTCATVVPLFEADSANMTVDELITKHEAAIERS
ncbi:hypothetical protein PsYK624_171450 [Phanerochaete sordida]|uniref:Uncharacterized protein n=1 Tax=Phanerochaete sordida TaxID=48140 RepID=A0A9P3LPS4_9APHY|nr:hypothetical protein PsYK624_171450 [Phanerochaete sordida]